MTSWTDEAGNATSYQYDVVGNLTNKGNQAFTYNATNQITNAGFTYDKNGNMTSDGKLNYFYNHENQLTKVTKVSDGSTVATYTYDYRGLRISKTTGSNTIYYHWDDQDRLIRESDTNGNTLALYIYAGDQLVAAEKNGAMYYVHTNQRGDILALTDINGAQVATYKYGPWGEFLGKTGTVDIPFRYAGYYYDNETGLYYLKGRYYNPELSRFLTKDDLNYSEIKNPQTLNLYAYANDNPEVNVDPNGHFVWMLVGAASGAITSYLIYKIEVKMHILKYDRNQMLLTVGAGAALGALNGGISGILGLGGIISKALKLGYITTKEAKKYRKFLLVKTMIEKGAISITNKRGSESWKSWAARVISYTGL